ncbi:MAG: GNAT family protein [Dehalococcoidia bacterium]
MTVIALRRCTLRPWRADDAPAMARHFDSAAIRRNLRDEFPNPYTLDAARDRLAIKLARPAGSDLAIEVDGEAVGSIGLTLQGDVYRHTASITYYLGETYWGRGIVTEAVGAFTVYAFATFDLNRIEARVFARNVASARVLERNGFALEGRFREQIVKDGEVLDGLLYGLLARDLPYPSTDTSTPTTA